MDKPIKPQKGDRVSTLNLRNDSPQIPTLEHASCYLARGFSVIPILEQSKKPAIDWKPFQRTRATEKDIRSWFTKGPLTGIGIVTGSLSQVVVIDFDSDEAYELGRKLGLPKTPTVKTRRGHHSYFTLPEGQTVRNFQNRKDLPGIDLRGEGGYVVAPPSIYPDGMGQYVWLDGLGLDDLPLAQLPDWVTKNSKVPKPPVHSLLTGVAEGERNNALCRLAGVACHQGNMSLKELFEMSKLWNSLNRPPLADQELFATVSSIFKRHHESTRKKKQTLAKIDEIIWPEPEEPSQSLLPVPPLTPDLLPQAFRAYLIDVSQRLQVPLDYPAVTAIIMIAAIIGTKCGITPKKLDNWHVVPNLWGAVIGCPGQLKTPTMAEILGLLKDLNTAAKEEYDQACTKYEAELEVFNISRKKTLSEIKKNLSKENIGAQQKRLEELPAPNKPALLRYLIHDATPEKLLEILVDNPQGVLVYRDELTGLFANWLRSGRESERAFFLESWNGTEGLSSDRIGRGSQFATFICVSLIGSIQPDRLYRFLCDTFEGSNDGLLQRFQLAVYPDRMPTWRNVDKQPNQLAKARVKDIASTLAKTDFLKTELPIEIHNNIPCLRFSDTAQLRFNAWLETLENQKLRNDCESDAMLEHLAKYRSLIPSLALVYHLTEYAEGTTTGPVSDESLKAAIGLSEHLEAHARRIYGMRRFGPNSPANRLAKYLQAGKLNSPFTNRDLYKANLQSLNSRELAQAAIDELVELGWLRPHVTSPVFGNKGKTEYLINPKILPRQGEQ